MLLYSNFDVFIAEKIKTYFKSFVLILKPTKCHSENLFVFERLVIVKLSRKRGCDNTVCEASSFIICVLLSAQRSSKIINIARSQRSNQYHVEHTNVCFD